MIANSRGAYGQVAHAIATKIITPLASYAGERPPYRRKGRLECDAEPKRGMTPVIAMQAGACVKPTGFILVVDKCVRRQDLYHVAAASAR